MKKILILVLLTVYPFAPAFAQPVAILPELPPIQESPAYKQFRQKPQSELSKMMYLIQRFKNLNVEIQYNSHRYRIREISPLIMAYVFANFDRKGTAREWVIANASYSRTKRNPILVHLQDGSHERASELLLRELEILEKTVKTQA